MISPVATVHVPPKCRCKPDSPFFGYLNATGEILEREVFTDLIVEERNVERSDLLHGEEVMSKGQKVVEGQTQT